MVGVLHAGGVLARLGCADTRSAAVLAAAWRWQAASWSRPVGCSWHVWARNYWGQGQQGPEAGWQHGDGVQRPQVGVGADVYSWPLDTDCSRQEGSAEPSVRF